MAHFHTFSSSGENGKIKFDVIKFSRCARGGQRESEWRKFNEAEASVNEKIVMRKSFKSNFISYHLELN